LFANLPPLSPSLDKGGGVGYVREASPLFIYSFKGEGEEILGRGFAPLLPKLPLPLKSRAVQNVMLTKK